MLKEKEPITVKNALLRRLLSNGKQWKAWHLGEETAESFHPSISSSCEEGEMSTTTDFKEYVGRRKTVFPEPQAISLRRQRRSKFFVRFIASKIDIPFGAWRATTCEEKDDGDVIVKHTLEKKQERMRKSCIICIVVKKTFNMGKTCQQITHNSYNSEAKEPKTADSDLLLHQNIHVLLRHVI